MKKKTKFSGICSVFCLTITLFALPASALTLKSDSIEEGKILSLDQVFNSFGCSGKNLSPQLSWSEAPEGTKSFAITVYDPDAPTGSGWWHWLAFDIPANISSLSEGVKALQVPMKEGRTDFGSVGFGGACPPEGHGDHRYIVTIFALDTETLPVDENASGALIGYYLNSHKISSATITGIYSR